MPDVCMLVGEIGGTRCFPRVALESALDPYKSYHICQKKRPSPKLLLQLGSACTEEECRERGGTKTIMIEK